MALFLKAAAGILLTVILLAQLRQKELSVLLSMAVCAMACCGALRLLVRLLKSAGIGLTAEVSASICADGGNGALAKVLRLLGSAAILCLSVPMLRTLMDLIQEMVGTA